MAGIFHVPRPVRQSMVAPKFTVRMYARNQRAEILVFGDILGNGGISAKSFVEQLNRMKSAQEITVRINSDGGDPFQALAMYHALRSHGARIRTVNEGMAASAASLLFMAGDIREVKAGSQVMIHEPVVTVSGRADAIYQAVTSIEKTRDDVAKIYAQRSGLNVVDVLQMMKAERYFNADEAVQFGIANSIS